LVLEREEVARARGANILAEIVGYHCCTGADNIYKPYKLGYQRTLAESIKQAGWEPKDIDLINGHATATRKGDNVEADGIKSILCSSREMLLQDKYAEGSDMDKRYLGNTHLTAFKGNLGHLNLASGATEVALCIKAMQTSTVPPVANLKDPVDDEMTFAMGKSINKEIKRFMKIAVGFGGNNAAMAIQKYEP
jgi:3-oxoacyl-[acyl-carrier-protein] synthase II